MRSWLRSLVALVIGESTPAKPLLALPSPEMFTNGQAGAHRDVDLASDVDYGVGGFQKVVTPGFPERAGQPVPRWPEHGAALMAATPEELLLTQDDLVQRLRSMSPLPTPRFDHLIMPALHRYAAWVHLLPASENHHHSGPGGLLRHGLEVALHAARMAEGRHVGIDLPPSTRHRYELRWRVATMFGGLFHDLGKPLVDCGATDADRTITWPAHAGDLYSWLVANKMPHYRIYWRSGKRHERHKPVGTAVMREILGAELLTWLSDEPTHEVMGYLVTAVSNVASASNAMSLVVSKADSLSVEEDLKRMALRTQATGTGASTSAAALVVGRLRQLVETNRIKANRPGGQLWCTPDGVFGVYPAIIDSVIGDLRREDIPSLPANRGEIADLLAETGFVQVCNAETSDGPQRSLTWDLRVEIRRSDRVDTSAPMKVLRFTEEAHIFGAASAPPPHAGSVTSPFVTDEDARRMADDVRVAEAPQTAESAVQKPLATSAAAAAASVPAESAQAVSISPGQDESQASEVIHAQASSVEGAAQQGTEDPNEEDGIHVADRRNRRDLARERTHQRENDASKERVELRELIRKINGSSLCGPAVAEVLRRIFQGALTYGTEYFDTPDGLAIAYPDAFEKLGMPPEDILDGAVDSRWVFSEAGSDRMVSDRAFPDGRRRRCILLTGLVGQAWEELKASHPEVLEIRPKPAGGQSARQATGTVEPNGRNQAGQHAAADPADQRRSQVPPQTSGPSMPTRTAVVERSQQGAQAAPQRGAVVHEPRAAPPRRKALDVPATGAAPPNGGFISPAAKSAPRPQVGQPAATSRPSAQQAPAGRGSEPGPIACNLITDLTPSLIADINATFVLGVEQLKLTNPAFDETNPEDLKAVMRFMVTNGKVRAGPLLTALQNAENSAIVFKMPPSMSIKEIKTVRLNPAYQRPAWIAERLRKVNESLHA